MPGLHKAWVFVCAMVVSAWPWSSPVWYQGKLWKRHEPTGWWAEVNLNGELAHEDDWDWFLEHGFEVPLANKRRKKNPLQSIDEEEEEEEGKHSSSSTAPSGLPAQGKSLDSCLADLQDLLMKGDVKEKAKFDRSGYRSQLRRTVRRLCERENLPFPGWLSGDDMTIHQYKNKVIQFIDQLLKRRVNEAERLPASTASGSASSPAPSGLPAQGNCHPAEPCPAAEPAASGGEVTEPSPARIVLCMMENVLSSLETLHPGVRSEVREAFGSPRMPERLPAQGNMTCPPEPVSPPEESDTNSSYQEDPRRTRSEPPRSPKQSVEEEALPSGLPAQGSAAPEPDVEMNPELPAVPLAPAEEATPVNEHPPASALHGGLPEQGSADQSMNGSYQFVEPFSDIATEASFTMVDGEEPPAPAPEPSG